MKFLFVVSIFVLIAFAGCDEMQNQVMKPVTMPDTEAPTEDTAVTSVGTMKDPPAETDDSKEDTSDEPQSPDAAFVSASPASGDLSSNGSIKITFDNNPGAVTVSAGTVAGSGKSRTISAPEDGFTIGALALEFTWENGGDDGHTLNYTVVAADETPPEVTSSSPENGAKNVDPQKVFDDGIMVAFDEPVTGDLMLMDGDDDIGWTSKADGNKITLTGNAGQELSNETEYTVAGEVMDGAGNKVEVSITFTTESAPAPPPPPQTPVAAFVSASPASGDISENDSITVNFDNDPGTVTANAGTVTGAGNSRTISGPFSVGALALTISWINGSGSYTLSYNVMAEDTTSLSVTTSSTTDDATDVDPAAVSESGITVTFSEPISSGELRLLKNGVDVGWTVRIDGRTITLTANTGQELSHETTYQIVGTVKDAADNETDVSITFTTKSAPAPPPPQTPVAVFVSASPASGDISENDSITVNFDNDPGTVTASAGTVTGSGNSRTISGPFSVGSLILTISWTNGSRSHTLSYNVMAEDTTSPSVTTSSTTNGATDVDPAAVSESGITITFSEPISSGELRLLKNGVDVGWTVRIDGRTITLTANTGQELSHDTTYEISGTVQDAAENETDVSITFTTESAPAPPPETLDPGEGLSIGAEAPDFTLPDGSGTDHTLSDSIGSSNVVIVFFRGGW